MDGELHRSLGEVRREHLRRLIAVEGRTSREHLVGDDAEGVDVRAMIGGGIGGGLLRRHVRRSPDGHAGRGAASLRRRPFRARHAEVRDQRVAAREQDVLRLDVAVHESLLVRVPERVAHLDEEAEGLLRGEPSLPADLLAE